MDKSNYNAERSEVRGSKGSRPHIRISESCTFAVAGVVFAIFTFVLLPLKNGPMLRWYEEMSFFTPDMFSALMRRPGGLVEYAGAYLTQFLFYPWLGTSMLLALWLSVAYVVASAFRLKGIMSVWAFLPVMCLLLSALSFDEAWITLRSYGSLFTPALGFLAVSLIIRCYRSLPVKLATIRCLALVAVGLTYPLFGFYSLFAVGICALGDLADAIKSKDWRRALPSMAGAVSVTVIPWIYYYMWSGSVVDSDSLYLSGLPGFRLDMFDRYMWVPFALMAVLFMSYAVVKWQDVLERSKLRMAGAVLFIGLGVYAVYFSNHVPAQLRSTVAMLRYIDHNQWDKVGYEMARSECIPDIYMAVYDNLARQKRGLEMVGGEILPMDTVQDNPRKKSELLGTVFLSIPANYHLGKVNSSYQWSMENMVAYGESVYYLKYMVRVALCNGEYRLAEKYNDRLMGTMFHRYWAEHYKKYIDNPELMRESAEFNSIPEYVPESVFQQYGK